MSASKTKALIIENDKHFVDEITAALPGYIDPKHVFFVNANEELETGDVELVILNEASDAAFGVFKHISEDDKLKKIPVVIVTEDAYSDNAFRYYDVGVPHFHEGVVDDTEFYMTVSDAIDEMALYEEIPEDEIETENAPVEKSSDRLMGMSISMNAPGRVASYDDDTVKDRLSGIVKKTKKSVETTWDVIEEVVAQAEAEGEEIEIKVKHSRPSSRKRISGNKWSKSGGTKSVFSSGGSKWGKAKGAQAAPKQNIPVQNIPPQNFGGFAPMSNNFGLWNGVENVHANMNRSRASQLLDAQHTAPLSHLSFKPKVLIVDSDENTIKAFNLFLENSVECEQVDSSMKAIDYVVKNKIDLVVIAQNIKGVSGLTVLNSVKNQPGGMMAKEMFLIDKDASLQEIQQFIQVPGITGIVRKPIIKKQLVSEINRAFL